jgi:chemotaxis protein histidine kinase CheA
MDERSKDPPAEANAAEAGRQPAEADRDKAEQQEAAEGERRRAEKGREIHEEIRATAEVMRDMGENASEAADQARVSADGAREAARQSAHHLVAAQAETARVRADVAEVRRLLELTREAAEEQRRLLEEMRCSLREYERRFGPGASPASEPLSRDRAGGAVHGEGAGGAAVAESLRARDGGRGACGRRTAIILRSTQVGSNALCPDVHLVCQLVCRLGARSAPVRRRPREQRAPVSLGKGAGCAPRRCNAL